jgi:hypothetical protein
MGEANAVEQPHAPPALGSLAQPPSREPVGNRQPCAVSRQTKATTPGHAATHVMLPKYTSASSLGLATFEVQDVTNVCS